MSVLVQFIKNHWGKLGFGSGIAFVYKRDYNANERILSFAKDYEPVKKANGLTALAKYKNYLSGLPAGNLQSCIENQDPELQAQTQAKTVDDPRDQLHVLFGRIRGEANLDHLFAANILLTEILGTSIPESFVENGGVQDELNFYFRPTSFPKRGSYDGGDQVWWWLREEYLPMRARTKHLRDRADQLSSSLFWPFIRPWYALGTYVYARSATTSLAKYQQSFENVPDDTLIKAVIAISEANDNPKPIGGYEVTGITQDEDKRKIKTLRRVVDSPTKCTIQYRAFGDSKTPGNSTLHIRVFCPTTSVAQGVLDLRKEEIAKAVAAAQQQQSSKPEKGEKRTASYRQK